MPFQDLARLRSYLPEIPSCETSLRAALEHALDAPGSLARARLTYSVASELQLPENDRLRMAVAMEFFHLASLLLDDLPCMDDSDTRRNQPCTHKEHGEGPTILASLALINRAYSLLWLAMAQRDEEAMRLIDECLGLSGVVNGQALDLGFGNGDTSPAAIEQIALQKTGALFRLCLLLPAIVGGASRYEKMHLARLAALWGSAYQIADDLKDLLLGEAASGKTSQRDARLGRPNMALALGVEQATALLRLRMEQASASTASLRGVGNRDWSGIDGFQTQFLAKVAPLIERQAVA